MHAAKLQNAAASGTPSLTEGAPLNEEAPQRQVGEEFITLETRPTERICFLVVVTERRPRYLYVPLPLVLKRDGDVPFIVICIGVVESASLATG